MKHLPWVSAMVVPRFTLVGGIRTPYVTPDAPFDVQTWALNSTCCARADPSTGTTVISEARTKCVLWSLPSWQRVLFLSRDGTSLLVAVEPYGKLPEQSDTKSKALRVFRCGELLRSISIGELFPTGMELANAISRRYWGRASRFDAGDNFTLELACGSEAIYHLPTATKIST